MQNICEVLHLVGFKPALIMNDVVVGWRDSTLASRLADQEEIIPEQKKK